MPRVRNQIASERRKARHYALQALYKWHLVGGDPETIIAEFRDDYNFKNVDLEFFDSVLHSILGSIQELEDILEPILDRGLDELDPVERAVLRLGTYELLEREDVPYKVVINEAVALAKKFGSTDSYKYVNGVLDRIARSLRFEEIES